MNSSESIHRSDRFQGFGRIAILAAFAIGLLVPAIGMIMGQSGGVVAVELRNPANSARDSWKYR